MEDLASYFGGMGAGQRQMLMAEQLRARQQGDYQQRLGAAMQGDPRMRALVMAAMLSGNKQAVAATQFAHDAQSKASAPRQLGNTGFFNPVPGEFVENPMYAEEKRDSRDQRRWEKDLAADTARENTRARIDQQSRDAELRAQVAREAEAGRAERAASDRALRQTLAALAAGNRSDAARDRLDKTDEAALAAARTAAGKLDTAAAAERGDKQLSSKEMSDLQAATTRVRTLGMLSSRLGEGSVGPRGPLGGAGFLEEAKSYAAREYPAARAMLGPEQEFADQWWADYRAEFENLERNKLFGSALTAAETELWNKSNLSRGLPDEEIQRRIAQRVGISNAVLHRMTQGQAANRKDVDALQSTTEGFYTAPPKPQPTDPARFLAPDRAGRLRERGVIPTPSPTGSIAPNRTAPAAPPAAGGTAPAPVRTPDGWTVTVEQ